MLPFGPLTLPLSSSTMLSITASTTTAMRSAASLTVRPSRSPTSIRTHALASGVSRFQSDSRIASSSSAAIRALLLLALAAPPAAGPLAVLVLGAGAFGLLPHRVVLVGAVLQQQLAHRRLVALLPPPGE